MTAADGGDLRGARDSRRHLPAQIEGRRLPADTPDVGGGQRPRAHQRHVAAQDVDQLRQLVDAEVPQHRADRR